LRLEIKTKKKSLLIVSKIHRHTLTFSHPYPILYTKHPSNIAKAKYEVDRCKGDGDHLIRDSMESCYISLFQASYSSFREKHQSSNMVDANRRRCERPNSLHFVQRKVLFAKLENAKGHIQTHKTKKRL
jgi:hypothetical protein